MKKRRTIKVLIITVLVLTIGIGFFIQLRYVRNQVNLLNKLHVLAFNDNEISVDLSSRIDLESIIIKDQSGSVIYKNGQHYENLHNEYGDVIFSFYNDDKIFAQAGYFNTNYWFTNDYNIIIEKENEDYKIYL